MGTFLCDAWDLLVSFVGKVKLNENAGVLKAIENSLCRSPCISLKYNDGTCSWRVEHWKESELLKKLSLQTEEVQMSEKEDDKCVDHWLTISIFMVINLNTSPVKDFDSLIQ